MIIHDSTERERERERDLERTTLKKRERRERRKPRKDITHCVCTTEQGQETCERPLRPNLVHYDKN